MNKVRPVSLLIKLGILVLLAYITHYVPESAKTKEYKKDVLLAQFKRKLPSEHKMQ